MKNSEIKVPFESHRPSTGEEYSVDLDLGKLLKESGPTEKFHKFSDDGKLSRYDYYSKMKHFMNGNSKEKL